MSSYCEIAPGHPYHGYYHDKEYGFPVTTDNKLFERLVLEINQAGLSWLTILKKREGFRNAFSDYNPELVATYSETEIAKLIEDPSIIRNRLKINAVIKNAQKICELQDTHGSFCLWIERHHSLEKRDWIKLFKKTFLFTGESAVTPHPDRETVQIRSVFSRHTKIISAKMMVHTGQQKCIFNDATKRQFTNKLYVFFIEFLQW